MPATAHYQARGGMSQFGSRGGGVNKGGPRSGNPPEGYICHRCKEPGHFIHDCPRNGDPDFNPHCGRGVPESERWKNLINNEEFRRNTTRTFKALLKQPHVYDELSMKKDDSSKGKVPPPSLACKLCHGLV